jgi:hypothetical protein
MDPQIPASAIQPDHMSRSYTSNGSNSRKEEVLAFNSKDMSSEVSSLEDHLESMLLKRGIEMSIVAVRV